ncbi:hypothetical protein [Streptomyces mayonensis]|uniref:hypothetical protein n=1 Tax=Streptomyces mayonensis TaxID=2750816 RepID=UPI001C1DF0EB|nr:hypothetical protein [Streptomyces sp. A108]MBU6536118.1 hypothetical protein [Streptomyces sp. A108]
MPSVKTPRPPAPRFAPWRAPARTGVPAWRTLASLGIAPDLDGPAGDGPVRGRSAEPDTAAVPDTVAVPETDSAPAEREA